MGVANTPPPPRERVEGCDVDEYREAPAQREGTRPFVDVTSRSPGATYRAGSVENVRKIADDERGRDSAANRGAQHPRRLGENTLAEDLDPHVAQQELPDLLLGRRDLVLGVDALE